MPFWGAVMGTGVALCLEKNNISSEERILSASTVRKTGRTNGSISLW